MKRNLRVRGVKLASKIVKPYATTVTKEVRIRCMEIDAGRLPRSNKDKMEPIDVLKYKPVILTVLSKLKVKNNQYEDLTQECYLALLENQHHVLKGILAGEEDKYVAVICRSRILNLWNSPERKLETDSLDDPRFKHRFQKSHVFENEEVSEDLKFGLETLQPGDREIVWSLFVKGDTIKDTAQNLGLTIQAVKSRRDRAVKKLKKFFEAE